MYAIATFFRWRSTRDRGRCAAGVVLAGVLWGIWATGAAAADAGLADAAKARDWPRVAALIGAGADVDARQADGATALHWAAYWDEPDALEGLVRAGADVDARNDYGATPLWAACANRHTGAVERLLAAGADPNLGLASGETLLMRCAHTGDPRAVRALLAHGAGIEANEPARGQTALMWAVANRQPAATRVLLDHGAAVDARTRTVPQFRGTGELSTTSPQGAAWFDAGGFTPLLFAARHGDIESARTLLAAGADVNDRSADGNSALVVAAMSGHENLAAFLLGQGADPDAAGAGYTALHAAVLRSQPGLLRALLAAGADPDVPLVRGTPVPRWTYQFVFTLRERGATPFTLAAKYLEPDLVRALAEAGADALISMEDGTTALMAAVGLGLSRSTNRRSRLIAPELVTAEWGNEGLVFETVRAVIAAGGADGINASGRGGNTALHGAARNRYRTVADLLIAEGADPDIQNEDGTPARELVDRLAADAAGGCG